MRSLFLALLLCTGKVLANDLVGQSESLLPVQFGEPLDKKENSLTGKNIWYFNKYTVYTKNSVITRVIDLRENPGEKTTQGTGNDEQANYNSFGALPDKEGVFDDIMKEWKERAEGEGDKKSSAPEKRTLPRR